MVEKQFSFSYFNCIWFNIFINCLMYKGHKNIVCRFIKDFLFVFKFTYGILPLLAFYEILEKLRNPFFLMPYRRGAHVYMLPILARKKKQYRISIKWLIKSIKLIDIDYINNNTKLIETIIFKFEEILFIDDETIIAKVETDNVTMLVDKTDTVDKKDNTRKVLVDESTIEEYNTAFDYKWNVYKNILKNRFHLHFRWKFRRNSYKK
jgi:ribosomal protein S7